MSEPKEYSLIRYSHEDDGNLTIDFETTYNRKMNFISLKNDDDVASVVITLPDQNIDNTNLVITVLPGESFSGYFVDFGALEITATADYRLVVGGL